MAKKKAYRLPKTLTLFSKVYDIKYIKNVENVDDAKEDLLFGKINFYDNTVRVYLPDIDRKIYCTWHHIIHEIVHAIVENMGIKFGKGADEESIVNSFALGMTHFLLDNDLLKLK